ncbi:protocatechuate 3,4-dioxygenase alpha subunit [Deinococcus metalli]|uniref:Protocatechuate 3,4-dioxygenase alpha subunit n=1 Tax=Deinococcus metalli TaxID=1141878 RepID=A0A7W8KEM2_9DEIO|nr:protocatechuate 3,4-dioxygenase subunit alpha [Deinococcus metalli]MBB5376787.1 protocatechuate 3,4-dioxygenase alpha subunit [Deinococcus metalli]GHF45345.1 protocatechuate 3,4-dioxygenase subunit alpha [Deinococcus metalli]
MTTERPALTPETSNIPEGAFGPSPSQTVGPYFHQGLIHGFQGHHSAAGHVTVDPVSAEAGTVPGERIRVTGQVFDGDGVAIPDAMLEVWHADAAGRYVQQPGAAFTGFARTHTRTPDARYEVQTIKPGAAPGEAPRLWLWVGMRGLLTHLYTAVYFSDEDNSTDPLLATVPEARRSTLIARRQDRPGGATYVFDLRMQGEGETVFFTP